MEADEDFNMAKFVAENASSIDYLLEELFDICGKDYGLLSVVLIVEAKKILEKCKNTEVLKDTIEFLNNTVDVLEGQMILIEAFKTQNDDD